MSPAAFLVGCEAPTAEDGVETEGNDLPVGVGYGSLGASGGIPTESGGIPTETAGQDTFVQSEYAEIDDIVAPDAFEEVIEPDVENQHFDAEEEGGTPFAYECDPGDEEECETECGSNGYRICGKLWGPCIPPDEVCNGLDDNCDGQVDEELTNACGGCGPVPIEVCNGFDDDCDGSVDEGVTNSCGGCGPVQEEVCNGLDDDCDGSVDEGFQLNPCGGCGPAPVEVCNGVDDDCDGSVDEGVLNACGTCGPTNEVEKCDGVDNNCNGQVDENCICTLTVNFSGDCVTTQCPAQCPYPVGCDIFFAGGDKRGCVASQPNQSFVYFQEGDQCGAGSVAGTLICSSAIGEGLTPNTCAINKPQPIWTSSPLFCPATK